MTHNGQRLVQVMGILWMAVIKTDAYDHGPGPTALIALSAGTS